MTAPRITVPGKRPHNACHHLGRRYNCNRRAGHGGRHAYIWWDLGGVVRAVWDGTHQREVTHGS